MKNIFLWFLKYALYWLFSHSNIKLLLIYVKHISFLIFCSKQKSSDIKMKQRRTSNAKVKFHKNIPTYGYSFFILSFSSFFFHFLSGIAEHIIHVYFLKQIFWKKKSIPLGCFFFKKKNKGYISNDEMYGYILFVILASSYVNKIT